MSFELTFVAASYLLASLLSAGAMVFDKRAARRGRRRIPEQWLHSLELLGGWPGSFIVQQRFRHKNRKLSYQRTFWLIVAVHICVWGVYIWAR